MILQFEQFDSEIFINLELIENELNQNNHENLLGGYETMFFIFIVLLNGLKQKLIAHLIIFYGNYKN